MNYCQSCLVAKDISSCSESLTIGTGAADTAYTVYVKNLSTQRVDVFETVSTAGGLIIIDTTEYTFNEGNPYELWVTLENASPNSHEEITVGDFTTTCIDFSAIAYKNADDGCVKVIADEILIPEEDSHDFIGSDCVCVTEEDVNNWNAAVSSTKVYRALMSHDGGLGDPIVTVLSGNTIGNIVWTRAFDGTFFGTLTGAFPTKKTWGTAQANNSNGTDPDNTAVIPYVVIDDANNDMIEIDMVNYRGTVIASVVNNCSISIIIDR